jgi:oligopeptide/dipeptide ABC transporter ATP-binding protein
MMDIAGDPILSIRRLSVEIATPGGRLQALRDINLDIPRNCIFGLVGESGSGKSTLALSIIGLLAANARVTEGEILWQGRDLKAMGEREIDGIRGRAITTIFQDPMTSLNPVISIGRQMTDVQWRDREHPVREKRARDAAMLERVGISDAEHRLVQYVHQLSGGMRQRVAIAMALLPAPDLLIADEPTTALDVSLEAQIANLFRDLKRDFAGAILFVSHNLGLVAEFCDRVAVMYAGEIVETGEIGSIFERPCHPYTRRLLACDPAQGVDSAEGSLPTIPGEVPSLAALPAGCAFASRCPEVLDLCLDAPPPWRAAGEGHCGRCHRIGP